MAKFGNEKINRKAGFCMLLLAAAWLSNACSRGPAASLSDLMKARNLNEGDVEAALKTYTPSGTKDPYILFASGGHTGDVLVIGVPSMRILSYIPVFTREPYYGYGYDDATEALLESGDRPGHALNFGDVHHPALSETNGDYDGQYLFVNDKANARLAVISLKDFETKQIVVNPLIHSDHGAAFVTPNTDWVIEGSQYPAPLGGGYAPIKSFNDRYRGAVTFWKFNREKGRIDKAASFAMELPPYMQDIASAGKLASDGWIFLNCFDSERAYGGDLEGRPPLEAGASQNDMDFLHIINLKKAAQVAQHGGTVVIAGMRVIPLKTSIREGLLYFVGEPKSPHGVDVSPDGKDIVVSGKLDTHTTIYNFSKIQNLIASKTFSGRDPYGVAILPFKDSIRGQVEVGLGPLHTQFDGEGNAYTSLFLECAVAKWNLKDLTLTEKQPIQYNIGHLCVAGGDTEHPDGHYLVAMNKWSIDRFANVGPMMPRNFQLIDISGPKMQLLYDLPIAFGEPHYAQMIRADKLHPIQVYSPPGMDPMTFQRSPNAVDGGKERIVRQGGGVVQVYMTAVRSHFTPDTIRVNEGDTVHLHLTNLEQTANAIHGFALDTYGISEDLEPGKAVDVTFKANEQGVFPFYCTDFCSALHLEMEGYLIVKPKGSSDRGGGTPIPAASNSNDDD